MTLEETLKSLKTAFSGKSAEAEAMSKEIAALKSQVETLNAEKALVVEQFNAAEAKAAEAALAIAKVEEIVFDSVLHDSHDEDHIHLKPLHFPVPVHGLAIAPKRHGDEQRMWEILGKLVDEVVVLVGEGGIAGRVLPLA